MKVDNNTIIEGIKNGDHTIIKEFYKTHLPRITQYILKNSGGLDDAKDVFQDAMVILFEKIKDNSLKINCAIGTYVYGICKYLWLNKLKRIGKTELDDTDFGRIKDPTDDPIDLVYKKEKKLIIQKCLLKLGEGCQEILLMFFGGYSLKEIAKQKKFTDGYTRKRKFVCQKKLIQLADKDPVFKEFKASF